MEKTVRSLYNHIGVPAPALAGVRHKRRYVCPFGFGVILICIHTLSFGYTTVLICSYLATVLGVPYTPPSPLLA